MRNAFHGFNAYLLFALAMICTPSASGATISVDTVVDASNPFPLETVTVVDGADPPTNLTVVDGGLINSETLAIDAYGLSVIEINGGQIQSGNVGIRLHDDSRLLINDGAFDTLGFTAEAYDRAFVHVRGGAVLEGFDLYDESQLIYDVGDSLQRGQVYARGHSIARIKSGHFSATLEVFDSAAGVLNGGDVNGVFASNSSQAYIMSGFIQSTIVAQDDATIYWKGGTLDADEDVNAFDNATVHVYGTGLRFFEDPDDGPMLEGILADGSGIFARYHLRDQGQIILHEVPEPGAVGLLAVGAGAAGVVAIGRGGKRKSRSVTCGKAKSLAVVCPWNWWKLQTR